MFQGYTPLDPTPDLGVLPQALRALFWSGTVGPECLALCSSWVQSNHKPPTPSLLVV